ncbi:MAG: hypothetical protein E7355_03955 [Clostridiales bacterium]|nr:hypothetical protein [Clostridiales bacterium]
MEERIIDDEYGRGIRLKKTEDGYVDVTDELAEKPEEEGEEMAFEFPVLETDEDDEDLVGLSPEEALELRRKKAEAAQRLFEEYTQVCKEGERLLEEKNFAAAEAEFEKALLLDGLATAASVGYWRAKTEDFTNPDVLVGEYADASIESLEYDLGVEAVEQIKKQYKNELQTRYDELAQEEKPLLEKVQAAQERRRGLLSQRLKKRTLFFFAIALPMIAALVLTAVFALRIFTPDGEKFILWTIVLGCVSFLFFVAFIVATNKLLNALRMKRANEILGKTEDGAKLVEIQDYMTIYACLLDMQ